MTRLEAALVHLSQTLDAVTAPWALVGRVARSTILEPDLRMEIGIAVATADDARALTVVRGLQDAGYTLRPDGLHERKEDGTLALVQLYSPVEAQGGTRIDVFFAWSRIERDIVAGAWQCQIVEGLEAPVAQLGDLVALSLLAGRPIDLEDARALLAEAGEPDLERAGQALRWIQERGCGRGRNLLQELDALVHSVQETSLALA